MDEFQQSNRERVAMAGEERPFFKKLLLASAEKENPVQ
jgi:hypothetical protein